MEIKLIKRELKNGRTSLVLEYYLGYTLGANVENTVKLTQ